MPIIRIYVCFHEGGKRREKQKNPHLKQVLGRDPRDPFNSAVKHVCHV